MMIILTPSGGPESTRRGHGTRTTIGHGTVDILSYQFMNENATVMWFLHNTCT